jgi:hypothetical protein
MLPLIEADWTGPSRPLWFGLINLVNGTALDLVGTNASIRTRLIQYSVGGLKPPVPDQTKLNGFLAQYGALYPAYSTGVTLSSGYDAAYAVTYATVAAGPPTNGKNLVGSDIVRGLSKLNSGAGTTYFVGRGDFTNGINALVQNGSITLSGLTIGMNFDPSTGFVPITSSTIRCIKTGPASVDSGQFFNFTTGQLQGTFSCP